MARQSTSDNPPNLRPNWTALELQTVYPVPLAVAGLAWLLARTDFSLLVDNFLLLLLFFGLRLLLSQMDISSTFDGGKLNLRGLQAKLVTWSAALILGPTALWLDVFGDLFTTIQWQRRQLGSRRFSRSQMWEIGSQLSISWALDTLPPLAALSLFWNWGILVPLTDFSANTALMAFYATLVKIGLSILIIIPIYILDAIAAYRVAGTLLRLIELVVSARSWLIASVFLAMPDLFGILAAGLYVQNGLPAYLYLYIGLLLFSLLAHRVTKMALRQKRRSIRSERLLKLNRDLLMEPAGEMDLPGLLSDQVPSIFGANRVEIRLFPDHVLYPRDEEQLPVADGLWDELRSESRPYSRFIKDSGVVILASPIMLDGKDPLMGFICLLPSENYDHPAGLFQPMQSLAATVAAAIHQAESFDEALDSQAAAFRSEVYNQTFQAEMALSYQRISQEVALAGRIQSSFLPDKVPDLPGWEISVILEPARETSGDYFDFIPLQDGRMGLLIADVADKGIGPALYMALSRTLIRTIAMEYDTEPARVLQAANRRILADTNSDLFVTAVYAVLDPQTGLVTYCNAGHNPPFISRPQNSDPVTLLSRTALPLGLFDDVEWEQAAVQMEPGDVLTLYTDGVVEAQDEDEGFFGQERLEAIVGANLGRPVEIIEDKVMTALSDFAGDAPQLDDITLMIVVREK